MNKEKYKQLLLFYQMKGRISISKILNFAAKQKLKKSSMNRKKKKSIIIKSTSFILIVLTSIFFTNCSKTHTLHKNSFNYDNIKENRDDIILEKLITLTNDKSNLADFMTTCILFNRAIILDSELNELMLVTKSQNDLQAFIDDLLNFISQIEYLRKNNLIFVHKNPELSIQTSNMLPSNNSKKFTLSGIKNLQELISNNSPELYYATLNTIFYYMDEYISSFIYVRLELRKFVENGFKSKEDLRFEKTICLTRFAVIISFLGLIIAIILPFFTKTKIDVNQFRILNESIKKNNLKNDY